MVYQEREASLKPRVELDTFVIEKEERRQRKFTNAKAIHILARPNPGPTSDHEFNSDPDPDPNPEPDLGSHDQAISATVFDPFAFS